MMMKLAANITIPISEYTTEATTALTKGAQMISMARRAARNTPAGTGRAFNTSAEAAGPARDVGIDARAAFSAKARGLAKL
jgi:hypothetical protein